MNTDALARVPFAPRFARRFMVSTTDHVASSTVYSVLERGGNAADAAIAAAGVLSIVAQHQCGMGGDAFVVVRGPDGRVHALDASGRAGSGADAARARSEGLTRLPLRMDVRSATVPGAVDGWMALHERFGTWELPDLLGAGIGIARDGFAAGPTLLQELAHVANIHENHEFGRVTRAGDIVERPAAAEVLSQIARRGRAGFYEGAFGEGLVELGNGEFSEDDLRREAAEWVAPLSIDAFGARLWTVPPTSQGYLALASAWVADRLSVPMKPDDAAWAHLLIEAARSVGHRRERELHEGADGTALLDLARLQADVAAIDPTTRRDMSEWGRSGDTNYFCVVDGEGMAVSFIHSNAHGFGSHLVVPGTGIFLHNRGIGFSLAEDSPNAYAPGRKPAHTLAPVIATGADGSFLAALGTMGADSQPQVLLQLLHRMLVVGQDPGAALAAPRWVLGGPGGEHAPFDTWDAPGGASVHVEAHAPSGWSTGLRQRGHRVRELAAFNVMAGHAQAIVRHGGALVGAADPRALSGSVQGR